VIHICIPVHDEAATIGILLWKIRKVMAEFGRDYEISVLDDASTDNTAEVIERYRRLIPIRVERTEARIGYGAACERLLQGVAERSAYPKRDVAVTLQGDFTEDPADLVGMVKSVEGGADLVAGQLDDGTLPGSLRLVRGVARLLLGKGARAAPVSDPLSGYRAYRVVVLRKAFREAEEGMAGTGNGVERAGAATSGWAANLGLLARTAPHARRIDEAPYALRLDPRSRPTRFRAIDELKALLPLRRLRWPAAGEAA
jgi:glycosyltransferase involved in cell wall biosynthesis